MSLSLGAALGIGAGSSLLSSALNFFGAERSFDKQIQASKDLLDYQQQNYLSPKAQVKNLAAAGVNPAAAFGNTAPVNVGGELAMPTAPNYNFSGATQSLSDVASLLVGAAQAKKAGAEQPLIQNQAEGIALDNERKKMENDFMSRFGLQKSAVELAQAYANLELAYTTKDEKEQNIALSKVQAAKENALKEVNEKQRDILQKELDNKDTEIRLRNQKSQEEINTEKSKQTANLASAENQRSQAEVNRESRRLQSALADVEESGKHAKIDALLREYESKNLLSAADAAEARRLLETIGMARSSDAGKIVDSVFEWLKGKVSIFK